MTRVRPRPDLVELTIGTAASRAFLGTLTCGSVRARWGSSRGSGSAPTTARRTFREVVRGTGDGDLGAFPLRDGRHVVLGRADSLFLLDVTTGREEPLLSLTPELILGNVAVPRDESWIYFLTMDDDADLWLAELE